MKACKLVINDKYMYTGGAVYMEVKTPDSTGTDTYFTTKNPIGIFPYRD